MSPLTNQRSDRYGGGFHARMRFVTEIIGRARQLVGEDYPITCRIVGDELREGGIDMELSVRIARYLESLGVAALSVSAGMYPYVRTVSNMYHKHGVNLYLAENVREAVRIPVMAAGQIDRPEIQLHALETGKADILCIGRTLIADPDYPDKLREGRLDDIIHCIACNKGCHDRSAEDRQVKCALNVRTAGKRWTPSPSAPPGSPPDHGNRRRAQRHGRPPGLRRCAGTAWNCGTTGPGWAGGCVWPPCRRTRRVTAKPATIWSAKSANWAWTSI